MLKLGPGTWMPSHLGQILENLLPCVLVRRKRRFALCAHFRPFGLSLPSVETIGTIEGGGSIDGDHGNAMEGSIFGSSNAETPWYVGRVFHA